MSTEYNKQSAGYHGIKNVKYSVRDDNGQPSKGIIDFAFAKSISFDTAIDQQPVYANDSKILTIVSDTGYTGALGTTAQDRELEKALGQILEVDNGTADVNLISFKRIDLYYEFTEKTKNGISYIVKVWVLNIEISKANKSHSTDTNSSTLGDYSYPITVYGDIVKSADGLLSYKDAHGNELTATRIISVPSDVGYDTFSQTVPIVKMPTTTVTKNASTNK